MSKDGRGVDYDTLRESALFQEYVQLSGQLTHCDLSTLNESQRKAFFISILIIRGLPFEYM